MVNFKYLRFLKFYSYFKCLKLISLEVLIVILSCKVLNTDVKFISLSAKPLRFYT